ncbi:MAG: alkaline shock response membrane anchor protein AmaP [Firmicutes bacterium]|mgnify:FL=1|nr:alkaline shock response membrane anchor protein AmaP [Bacillota bacterium]
MILLDRVLLGITALLLAVLAGFLVSTVWGSAFLLDWLRSPNLVVDGSIAALILVLLAVYILVLVTRFERKKYIVYPRELGEVKISTACVESLIVEAAEKMPGLAQVRATFTDVVSPKVTVRVVVHPDHNLSRLSEDLQDSVRSYVEKTVGIVIQEVEVFVDGIKKADGDDMTQLDDLI